MKIEQTAPEPRIFPQKPMIGVGAIIIENDQVLLVERQKPPRAREWSLPGGAQEVGETTEQAVAREVKEETGLIIRPLRLFDVFDFIERDEASRVRFHYTLIDYLAEPIGGTLVAGSDAKRACWVRIDEIEALAMWHVTKAAILRASHEIDRPGRK
ncbi:MAG: NUDIX hydrolase [Pseudomonadota bacterium]